MKKIKKNQRSLYSLTLAFFLLFYFNAFYSSLNHASPKNPLLPINDKKSDKKVESSMAPKEPVLSLKKEETSYPPLFLFESQKIKARIFKIGESTQIEWIGRKNWSYQIKREGKKRIVMIVPPFDLETEKVLLHWKDKLIQKIKIQKNKEKYHYQVHFYLKKEDVMIFDYLRDKSSILVTDFYFLDSQEKKSLSLSSSKTVKGKKLEKTNKQKVRKKEIRKKKKQEEKVSKDKNNKNEKGGFQKLSTEKNKVDRSPDSSELFVFDPDEEEKSLTPSEISLRKGVFDASDPEYERFLIKNYEIKEESIIASKKNIYIKFPILFMKTSRFENLLEATPEYRIKKKRSSENQEILFLLKLFKKKKYFSFLKSYEHFITLHPRSYYDEMVRSMAVEVYARLWQKNRFKKDYESFKSLSQYVSKNYPDSLLTRRAKLLTAYAALENGNALEAIQNFQAFIKEYPHFILINEMKQALAEALLTINKHTEALFIYEEMAEKIESFKGIPKRAAIKSSYFIGDVYLRQKKYEKAIFEYQKSISSYPNYQYIFPNSYYNLAESLFWMGYYKEALSYYVKFLKYFPSHPHGGYAMTRIGEVLDILGASDKKVIGAFMESNLRFKLNPGADVAQIRMMSRNMESMNKREIDQALKEMNDISERSKLPRISEFVSLMIADGLYRRQEFKKSLNYLIDFYQKNPTTVSFSPFKKRILRNISNLIKEKIDQGKFMDSIQLFGTYDSNWLSGSNRMDISYFLAQSYELAGAEEVSEKIYKTLLLDLKKIENTWEEKERRVDEHLPSQESVYLRLASVAVKQREYEEGFQFLKSIKDGSSLSSREKMEKLKLLAIVSKKRGDEKKAEDYLKTLTQTLKEKESLATAYYKLAIVQKNLGKLKEAEQSINHVLNLIQKNLNPNPNQKEVDNSSFFSEIHFNSLKEKADILLEQGKSIYAVEIYMKLFDNFGEKKSLGFIRYKVGKILFEQGDVRGAEEVWRALDVEKDSTYLHLAQEQLEHFKWKKDYKGYVERIPSSHTLSALLSER